MFFRRKKVDDKTVSPKKDCARKKFKCPYCFMEMKAEDVEFRSMTAYSQQDYEAMTEGEKTDKQQYLEAEDEIYEKFWRRYPGSRPENSENNRTYETHPVISLLDKRFAEGLLKVRKDEDGFPDEIIDEEGVPSMIRICPHCHNRLPFEFGKYPVVYISIVGITSSGKTVFLSRMLEKIKEILMRVGLTVAGLCPEAEAFTSEHNICKGIDLPKGNATDVLNSPIPVNVVHNDSGRRYTLVFYDVAGENCVEPDQMKKFGPFIANADGIIMIMDPRQFSSLIYLGDEGMDEIFDPDRVAAAMYQAFGAKHEEGKCMVPLAASLSKSDLLREARVAAATSNIFRNIDFGIYAEPGFPYDDWMDLSTEVRMLLTQKTKKGKILDMQLRLFFPRHSYFAFSALNTDPEIVDQENGRYHLMMNPEAVRLEEPLYWILYELGIISKARRK